MVYLLAPHSSALQTSTTKFRQDFIGPLFIDTTLDKTHYRLKDTTGILLDGMYHMNHIKRRSVCTLQGILNTFNDYKKALKNTLLNKLAIESPDNKFVDITLKDGSKALTHSPWTLMGYASIAKHNRKAKYITMQKVNYRDYYHAQNLYAMSIKLIKMAGLIYLDQSKIPAYSIDDKRRMR